MGFRISFEWYAVLSLVAAIVMILVAAQRYPEFYPLLAYITTGKVPMVIMYNYLFVVSYAISKWIVLLTVGVLRAVEAEEIVESGRGFLTDTVIFLVMANPTIADKELPTSWLVQFICFIVTLKIYHLMCEIRVDHLSNQITYAWGRLCRLAILLGLLLLIDICSIRYFYSKFSGASTTYLWLLFESSGMLLGCLVALVQFTAHLVDIRLGGAWSNRATFIFYLEIVHDILNLFAFLSFIAVFFFHNPSRWPIYMTADIAQVGRQLHTRIVSLTKYRALTKNINEQFETPTINEALIAETCIICRDALVDEKNKPHTEQPKNPHAHPKSEGDNQTGSDAQDEISHDTHGQVVKEFDGQVGKEFDGQVGKEFDGQVVNHQDDKIRSISAENESGVKCDESGVKGESLADGIKKLNCGHIFHIECLKSWILQQQTCPTCRVAIEPLKKAKDKAIGTENVRINDVNGNNNRNEGTGEDIRNGINNENNNINDNNRDVPMMDGNRGNNNDRRHDHLADNDKRIGNDSIRHGDEHEGTKYPYKSSNKMNNKLTETIAYWRKRSNKIIKAYDHQVARIMQLQKMAIENEQRQGG